MSTYTSLPYFVNEYPYSLIICIGLNNSLTCGSSQRVSTPMHTKSLEVEYESGNLTESIESSKMKRR